MRIEKVLMTRVHNGWVVTVEMEDEDRNENENQMYLALFGVKPRRREDQVARIFYGLGEIANFLIQLEKAENLTDEVKP